MMIVIDKLEKSFGSFVALDGIDLAIGRGEFVGLLGPSGCGKTTTLNILAGFLAPNGGTLVVDGKDLAPVPVNKRGMGIVFQSYALFPHLTVASNVAFGLRIRRLGRAEEEQRVRAALELVRMGHLADRYPRDLSGGQQQRVAIARALAIQPKVLLLDEPLSNLDAKLREEMQVELKAIQERVGITTIMVTHDQAEALATCDRIAVMNRGKIEQYASPEALYNAPETQFVASFVGKSTLLPAAIRGGTGSGFDIDFAGRVMQIEPPAALGKLTGDVCLVLRPEKVSIVNADAGHLSGLVRHKVFQGNTWTYVVETSLGDVLVSQANDGRPRAAVGEQVGVDWPFSEVSLVPRADRA